MPTGIGPALPLTRTDSDGNYGLVKSMVHEVRQNFKTLLLTNPGERVMDANFGVGLPRFLFEQNLPSTWSNIESRIQSQAKTYIPSIRINSIRFVTNENSSGIDPQLLGIKIDFTIVPLKARQIFNIPQENSGFDLTVESAPLEKMSSFAPSDVTFRGA
tara:strand:- start:419 stop:895 length:477 start_codon:yes stop_codon:yes gene_type:complete